MVTSILSW